MIGPKVTATDGSTAIGKDNYAPIVNAGTGATVNVNFEQKVARELPSFLGSVIGLFAQQSLAENEEWILKELPPEVTVKLQHNNFPEDHQLISDYFRYGLVLERAYHGAEQQNSDARRLVRRRAGVTYGKQLNKACKQASIPLLQKAVFAKDNAEILIDAVVEQLLDDYASSKDVLVEQETAHLAISLIVADAVIECEVLERPKKNAITA